MMMIKIRDEKIYNKIVDEMMARRHLDDPRPRLD